MTAQAARPALQRVSLVDQTIDALLELIRDRGLRENDSLPSTAELAASLDVSRPVVREAIAELSGQGLLSRRQGRETLIALPDSAQFERILRLRFAIRGQAMEDLQDFREVIEVAAARLAAERSTLPDLIELTSLHNAMKGAGSEDARHRIDQDFHREIARISGNDMLLLTLEGITPLMVDLRRRAWAGWAASGRGVEPLFQAHAEILERIRERDPKGAAEAMAAHLAQASEGLRSGHAGRPASAPRPRRTGRGASAVGEGGHESEPGR